MKKSFKRYLSMALAGILAAIMLMSVPVAAKTKVTVTNKFKSYIYSDNSKKYKLDYQWEDSYNKKGVRTKHNWTSYNQETGKADSRTTTTFKYDKKGNILQAVSKEGKKYTTKEVYKYNKKGQTTRCTSYVWQNGKWKQVGYDSYKTTKTKQIITQYNGKKKVGKRVLTLNKRGQTTSMKTYDQKGKLDFSIKYQYDKKGNQIRYEMTYKTPDGTRKSVSTMKYDKYGNLIKQTYKDASYSETTTYKYSNFYKGNKRYPQTAILKRDGKNVLKERRSYKVVNIK